METTLGWHFNIVPFYINSHTTQTLFSKPKKNICTNERNNFHVVLQFTIFIKYVTNHIQQGSRDGDDRPGTDANGRFYFSPSTSRAILD